MPAILSRLLEPQRLVNLPAIVLEGVAVAFVFVRLRWALGLGPAVLVPAMLFAAAHVPGQLHQGHRLAYVIAFFVFNASLTTAVLLVADRSADVLWLGLIHYVLDVAIAAV